MRSSLKNRRGNASSSASSHLPTGWRESFAHSVVCIILAKCGRLYIMDLGWVDFDFGYSSLPDSAWTNESLAEWAEQLGKIGGPSKSKSTQPRYAI